MKQYNKPTVEIVELLISDSIAAIAPKTVYKKNSSTSGTGAGFSDVTVAGEIYENNQATVS